MNPYKVKVLYNEFNLFIQYVRAMFSKIFTSATTKRI